MNVKPFSGQRWCIVFLVFFLGGRAYPLDPPSGSFITRVVWQSTRVSVCYRRGTIIMWQGPSWTISLLKPGFYMLGKSKAIGYFSFCWPFQILSIYWIITRILSQILLILKFPGNGKWASGTGAQKFRALLMSKAKSTTDVPESTNFSFRLSGMIAHSGRSLGCGRRMEMLPILQICSWLSQTIGDISWQHLGLSGNNKIPDRLGFSQLMKTRLKDYEFKVW